MIGITVTILQYFLFYCQVSLYIVHGVHSPAGAKVLFFSAALCSVIQFNFAEVHLTLYHRRASNCRHPASEQISQFLKKSSKNYGALMLKYLHLYSKLVLKFVSRKLYLIEIALLKVKHKQSLHRFHDPHPTMHNACLPAVVVISLPLLALKTFPCLTQSFRLINHKKILLQFIEHEDRISFF